MKEYKFEVINYLGMPETMAIKAETANDAVVKLTEACEYPCKEFRLLKIKPVCEFCKYTYSGPVMSFDKCLTSNWSGTTTASSEKKARNNLTYRFKKEAGLVAGARITLPGELQKIS